jgi:hypothetical protein
MKAALRVSWTGLAFFLALAFPAFAIEREAPVPPVPFVSNVIGHAGPSVPAINAGLSPTIATPGALPGTEISPIQNAVVGAQPAVPGLDASLPPSPLTPASLPKAENEAVEIRSPADAQEPDADAEKTVPGMTPQTAELLEKLSPGNAAHIGDEQASGLAAQLIDPTLRVSGSADFIPEGADQTAPAVRLAPWQRSDSRNGSLTAGDRRDDVAAASPTRPTMAERLHYRDLWVKNIWFYIFTNIRNKWPPYITYWRKLRDSGVPPIVSRPREFFAAMRVFGQNGYFYVPGFTPLGDAQVLKESRETFAKFFDGPGIGDKERAAFEGFLQRAVVFNAERRAASKFRANVRDNMLKASTMTPDKIAPFFDGLPIMAKTADFQTSGGADAILAQFKQTALEVLAEEPADSKDRVTGVILIGSFAIGAATPKSDFDIEPITADGTPGRVRSFADKVTARWTSLGRQETNPVSFHYFGYLNSRWEIRAIHHEPYIIISHDQSIIDNLAMRPGEGPSHVPTRERTLVGRFLRGLQYGAVYATTLFSDPK